VIPFLTKFKKMKPRRIGEQGEDESFALHCTVLVLAIGLAICGIYQYKNNLSLDGLTTHLAGYIWIIGLLTAIYTLIKAMKSSKRIPRKLKKAVLNLLCVVGVLVSFLALYVVKELPKAACIPVRAAVEKIVRAFPDSARAYINRLPADGKDDDFQSVKDTAQAFRKEALDKAIAGAGVTAWCHACYLYLLDSVRTDTLAVWCSLRDTLVAIGAELRKLIRTGDINAIPVFLHNHHLQDARIVQQLENHDYAVVAKASGYLKDVVQLNKTVHLQPVWRNATAGEDPEDLHIDFVVSI
jgi:amino acid transporter